MSRVKEIDIRPLLRDGEAPCTAVHNRVRDLKEDEILRVKAPFLPSPLIEKLNSEGFLTRVERTTDGSWTLICRRGGV